MKPATKKALLKSIEHWRENENVERIEDAKIEADDCALCKRFQNFAGCFRETKTTKEKCPVYKTTGEDLCGQSPYLEAKRAYLGGYLKEFREAAKKEREFLEGLLPDEN